MNETRRQTKEFDMMTRRKGSMQEVHGWLFPSNDRHCHKVVLGMAADLIPAINLCKKRRVCVQAGGNVGVFPHFLAQEFTSVITFEPDRANFGCLTENLKGISNIEYHLGALGHLNEPINMAFEEGNCGAHFVAGTLSQREILDNPTSLSVPMSRLDSLQLYALDFLALDVEGYEPRVLEGGREAIEKFRPVIMVEDKGLSEKYGTPKGWSKNFPGYKVAKEVHRDVILVPEEIDEEDDKAWA